MSSDVAHPEAVRIHTTTMERYVYLWTIENVSSYLKGKRPVPIEETMYMRNGDMEWLLNFYPLNSKLERHKCNCRTHYRKCFIRLKANLTKSKVSENMAEGKFQILDKHHRGISPKSACQALCNDVIDMDVPAEKSLLETLPDDLLKLLLEIKVTVPVHKVTEMRPCTRLKLQQRTYKELPPQLQTKEFMDMVIIVGDTVIPAHQVVLGGASPVFSKMLDRRENNLKQIKLSDLDVETTNILLNFIYSNKAPAFDVIDGHRVVKVLEASCKYVIDDLKVLASNYLMSNLNSSNVVDILLLADAYGLTELKEKAMNYIFKNKFDFSSVNKLERLATKSELLTEILAKSLSFGE